MLQLSMDFFLGVLSNLQLWNLGQNFVSVFIYSKPFANVQLALVSQIWTIKKFFTVCLKSKTETITNLLLSLQVPSVFSAPMRLHASNPNLSTIDFVEEKNYSDGSETSSEFTKMQEDLFHIAHKGE